MDQVVVQQEILDQVILVEQEILHLLVQLKDLKVDLQQILVLLLLAVAVGLLQREMLVIQTIVRDQVLLVLLDQEEMVQQLQSQDLQLLTQVAEVVDLIMQTPL